MTAIVTQGIVFDYISTNPGSTTLQIADALDAPVSAVKARLMSLLYKNTVHRVVSRFRLDSMYYYPNDKTKIERTG